MIWPSHNVLSAMAENAKPDLTRTEVGATKGAEGKRLDMCLLKLRRLGLVALEGGRYTLTPAGRAFLESGKRLTSGPRGPQPGKRLYRGTLRERAWHLMRIRRKFSLGDILERLPRDGQRDAESNIGKYVRALARAGFLTEIRRKKDKTDPPTSNGNKRYLLVDDRDTGPQAPRWLPRRGCVYDPNTEREHPL